MNANPPGSSEGGGGPCGACKFLRRKCAEGCIFAPYFDSEQGATNFAAVHKVFGASNVSKLLLHIPTHKRLDAVNTICYEAQARLRDPVYGCVTHIFALQQQVVNLQAELSYLHAHLTSFEVPIPSSPPTPQPVVPPPPLSTAGIPPASTLPPTYDLSNPFDPMAVRATRQQQTDTRQFGAHRGRAAHRYGFPSSSGGGGDDLHALARGFLI